MMDAWLALSTAVATMEMCSLDLCLAIGGLLANEKDYMTTTDENADQTKHALCRPHPRHFADARTPTPLQSAFSREQFQVRVKAIEELRAVNFMSSSP